MKPLTREEVATWPPLGPMNLDPARVLALLDERDAACADAARLREAFEKAIPWIGAGHANGDKESCSACDRIAAARKILAGADSTWLAERDAKAQRTGRDDARRAVIDTDHVGDCPGCERCGGA